MINDTPKQELLKNLKGILAWIEHAKSQPKSKDHMPDDEYLKSAYDAIKKVEGES